MSYYVTRQSYWHEGGECAVELVRAPSFDYVGPDMLASRPGIPDGGEHDDPRDAAREALDIVRAWPECEGRVVVANGVAMQMVYPAIDDALTPVQTLVWADAEYAAMPKCDACGDGVSAEENYTDCFGEKFTACSESCADRWVEREYNDPEGDDDDDD